MARDDCANPHVWHCLGEAYRARGNLPSAIKAYDEVLRRFGEDVNARIQVRHSFLL
jgi:cytochrome c-type biogenesis protein CcmH/NrfG